MVCTPELAEILARMLETAILSTRSAIWSGRPDVAAIEADHAHNLPGLIADFSDEGLSYYWNVERPAYIQQLDAPRIEPWLPLWDRLRTHVASESIPGLR